MKYLSIQKLIISAYRLLSFMMLSTVLFLVVGYLLLLVFYTINTSWAAPIVLGPTQDRVLAFQPQISNIESAIEKQRVELSTALSTKEALDEQISQVQMLIEKVDSIISAESQQLTVTSKAIKSVLASKNADIFTAKSIIAEAQKLLKTVDQELSAKLITSDQASQRKIALQNAISSISDAKIAALSLQEQLKQSQSGIETLNGGSTSSQAFNTIRQSAELKSSLVELRIQSTTAKLSAIALHKSITEAERVMLVAKSSPYYRALREEVTVAFVPYDNDIHIGDPIYDCYLQILLCRKVGVVKTIYEAEEHARHPLFKTDFRGRLVEIQFTDRSFSKSQVVFINGKPLLL